MASIGLSVLACAGCTPGAAELRIRMESADPADRIRAIRAAGDRGDSTLLPALVDRLDDDDVAVRLYAILALEKLTGTRLGFSYFSPAYERQASVEAWRRYVTGQAGNGGAPIATAGDGPKTEPSLTLENDHQQLERARAAATSDVHDQK